MTTPFDQPGAATQRAGTTTEDTMESGRSKAEQVKQKITEEARTRVRQARDKAGSAIDERKGELAGSMASVAGAVRASTDQLRGEGHDRIAGYVESLAQQFDRAAGYLRERDTRALRDDLEDIARRQPALMIGAAFAVGVLAARFFRSSDRETAVQPYDPDFGSSPAMGGGFDATRH